MIIHLFIRCFPVEPKTCENPAVIKQVLLLFSKPKYLKSLLQNYVLRNPRIIMNFIRKVFMLFYLRVFLVLLVCIRYIAWLAQRAHCACCYRKKKKRVVSHFK